MAVVPVVRPDVAPYSAHEAPDRTIRIASGVVTHDLHLGDKIIVDGDAPIVANGMSRQALYALAAHMDERYWGRVAEWFDAVPFAPPVLVAVIDHDTPDRDSPTSPIAALFVRQADPARHVPRSAALVLLDRLAVDTRVGAMRGRILGEERRQFGHLPGYVPTQFAELEPTSILMLSEDPLFRSVTIRDGQGREAFSDVELRLLDDGRIELSRPRLTRNERREQATGRRPRQDMVVICDGRPSGATRARRAAGRAARSLMRGIIHLGFDEEWLGDGHDGTMFERAS